MKLYMDAGSPFARKARVIAHELKLKMEELTVSPRESEELKKVNPLGKIPALALDDGSVLFDSAVICEYLNQVGSGTFFPGVSIFRSSTGRWRALVLQSLADGLCDALVFMTMERRKPEGEQDKAAIAHQREAVDRTLDVLERLVPKFAEHPTIGEVATGCALGYLEFRHGYIAWRDAQPALAAWYDEFAKYPSMLATAPK